MRKLIGIALLSCLLFSGCTDENYVDPFPDGSLVIHKLSKRKGQVINHLGFGEIQVRFVNRSTITTPQGIISHEEFEDVRMRAFEIELADQPAPTPTSTQKAN